MDIMENYNLDNKELDDGRVLFMKIHNAFSSGNFRPLGRSISKFRRRQNMLESCLEIPNWSKNNQYTAIKTIFLTI